MSETDRGLEARGAISAESLLRRIFDIVADEAARNPELMMRLTQEIASAGEIKAPAKPKPRPRRAVKAVKKAEPEADAAEDELANFNPIAMAAEQGADALRDHLRFVRRKDPLARIAKRFALDVPSTVLKKKASLPDMVEAIVKACERRRREQELSGG
ncbi:MAG: hypothetical protein MRY74_03465 [Neomegalonema sp.]|nr:hypothetical protein [Neomegalonema sp.]